MNTFQQIPSGLALVPEGQIKQPEALTPGVMVFFMTVCFLSVLAFKR